MNQSADLVRRVEIENSPFVAVELESEEGKFCIGMMGSHKVTEKFKTIEEVKNELLNITWNRVVQVIIISLNSPHINPLISKKNEKSEN